MSPLILKRPATSRPSGEWNEWNDDDFDVLAAATDGVRRAVDLIDVLTAISAASTLAAETLQQIEHRLHAASRTRLPRAAMQPRRQEA
jgi:hypothetical protein